MIWFNRELTNDGVRENDSESAKRDWKLDFLSRTYLGNLYLDLYDSADI